MDFTLSEDQVALRDGVREFCSRRYDEDALTAESPADASLWHDLAELGLFALRLPEPDGSGLGFAETALAFEELGRALIPGPLVGSQLASGVVDGASEGRAVVGVVDAVDDPIVIEHPGFVTELLVVDGADTRRVAVPDGAAAALPIDPLTPVQLIVGALPVGEPVDLPDVRLIGALLTASYQVGIAA